MDANIQAQLQKALIAIRQLKEENSKLKSIKNEPIAIIGAGCCLPGGIKNIDDLWNILINGTDAITEVPEDRWSLSEYYSNDNNAPNKMYTKYGGFIDNAFHFDPLFFGISPKEAQFIDPQQRLLLNVCWEALENACLPSQELQNSKTGVFVGMASYDNALIMSKSGVEVNNYSGTGNALSAGAGRISHVFGFTGPSITIDTACSSSIVSIHLASNSLRNNECELAIAGGVNIILSPEVMINFCKTNMLSADGRCKTFDASADGYVRSEGCGIVILKKLSKAIKDRDPILGIIKGSAINQDGKSGGLTVPFGPSQESVIKTALENAGIFANQVDYVECHGTGTPLGDPIEVEALGNIYSQNRDTSNPLIIGSLKTNIGHLEAAAGVSGLIKAMLCLKNRYIPPHLHFKNPNPHIPWSKYPLLVPKKGRNWNSEKQKRYAGVSSFGFSGTNAHVILEEVSGQLNENNNMAGRDTHILTLSAKSKEALSQLCGHYIDFINSKSDASIPHICYTSTVGRDHYNYRFYAVANNKTEILNKLSKKSISNKSSISNLEIAFLFTGQGSQYINMGRTLFRNQPVFRKAMEQCQELLSGYLDVPLLELLYNKENQELLNRTLYTQPALFALEYSLFQMWKSWGIVPKYVMGHSVGEYVAACIAGVFNLEDALNFITHRAKLMENSSDNGVMFSTNAPIEKINDLIAECKGQIFIAAKNGLQQNIISGDQHSIKEFVKKLSDLGYYNYKLNVAHAFHSPLMNNIINEFRKIAQGIQYQTPHTNIISNLTGNLVTNEMCDPQYWCRQITEPVNFYKSLKCLEKLGVNTFLEIGAEPILLSLTNESIDSTQKLLLPVLRKNVNDWLVLMNSLGALYKYGAIINWENVHNGFLFEKETLPGYPFQAREFRITGTQKELFKIKDKDQFLNLLIQDTQFSEKEKLLLPSIIESITRFTDKSQTEKHTDEQLQFEIKWEAYSNNNATSGKNNNMLVFSNHKSIGPIFKMLTSKDGNSVYIIENQTELSVVDIFKQNNNLVQSKLPIVYIIDSENQQTEEISDIILCHCWNMVQIFQQLSSLNKLNDISKFSVIVSGSRIKLGLNHDKIAINSNSLLSMADVVKNEMPWIETLKIETTDLQNSDVIQKIYHLVNCNSIENHIYVDPDKYLVPRLDNAFIVNSQLTEHEKPVSPDKTYLITGGTGFIGLHIAKWLCSKGAKNIVLLSRSGQIAETEQFSQLQNKVENLLIKKTDVANAAEMQHLFLQFGNELPSLGGIIHTAGILDDGIILHQTRERFQKVFNPKIDGSVVLHNLSKDIPLDFFVMLSSISSITGTPGQSNYVIANSFMNTLAQLRIQNGLPCISLNLGPLDNGMAKNLKEKQVGKVFGIKYLEVEKTVDFINKLIVNRKNGVFYYSDFDKQTIGKLSNPLFKKFIKSTISDDIDVKSNNIRSEIDKLAREEKCTYITNYLTEVIAELLCISPAEIDTATSLLNYGFDSFFAIQFKNILYKDLNINLQIHSLMRNSNISDLTIPIVELLENSNLPAEKFENLPQDVLMQNINQMSENEIDNLLKQLS